jgi:hypothetical protein
MPTGYTCIIEDRDDVTFEEFALRCARAFGYCIEQRDESLDAPPREKEPSSYYRDCLASAQARLEHAKRASDEELRCALNEENRKIVDRNEELRRAHAQKQARYMRMIAKLTDWCPPTPEHVRLKDFMTEQIALCFSTDEKPYEWSLRTETVAQYRARLIADAEKDIERAEKDIREEAEGIRKQVAWIRNLRANLREYGE